MHNIFILFYFFLSTPSNKLLLLAYQNVYYLVIKNEKDLLIFGQILNFKPLCATPATAAVFYCNSSTTLASAMYYTMAESFFPKIMRFFFNIQVSIGFYQTVKPRQFIVIDFEMSQLCLLFD